MRTETFWMVLPAALAWMAALGLPSTRRAFVNGWRCAVRHSALWKIPALFALANGLFHLGGAMLMRWRMDAALFPSFQETQPPGLPALAAASLLPAGEMLAAALNCLVATFPISILCGALFLLNAGGIAGELRRTLARRFGLRGWLLFFLFLLCAAGAVLKPLPLLALPELAGFWSFREIMLASGLVNAFSFAFEYLLGTCFQVALVLIAYGWVRGLHFDRARLLPFAVRRLGVVFQWAAAIILASLLLVHLPLLAEAWLISDPAEWRMHRLVDVAIRPALAVVMLALATVQIRLVLHNDTLRGAIARHGQFLRHHGFSCLVFLLASFALLAAMQTAAAIASARLGEALPGALSSLILQSLSAAAGGWVLASWVCFYKNMESGTSDIAF